MLRSGTFIKQACRVSKLTLTRAVTRRRDLKRVGNERDEGIEWETYIATSNCRNYLQRSGMNGFGRISRIT